MVLNNVRDLWNCGCGSLSGFTDVEIHPSVAGEPRICTYLVRVFIRNGSLWTFWRRHDAVCVGGTREGWWMFWMLGKAFIPTDWDWMCGWLDFASILAQTRKVIASLVVDRRKVRSSPLRVQDGAWLTISEPRAAKPSSLFFVILSHYPV